MTAEEIDYETRTLHEKVLICERCKINLIPSDRGWRCSFPVHPGIDNDQVAAHKLVKITTCDETKAKQIVQQYRLFAAGKTVSERKKVFAKVA